MSTYPAGDLRNRDPRTVARSPLQFAIMIAMHLNASPNAFELGRSIYFEFLADEKIKFGDQRYAWNHAGARDIAQQYMTECA